MARCHTMHVLLVWNYSQKCIATEETKARAPTIISSRSSCGAQYQVFAFVVLEVTVPDWMRMPLYPSLPFRPWAWTPFGCVINWSKYCKGSKHDFQVSLLSNSFLKLFIFIIVCVCVSLCVICGSSDIIAHMWRSEDNIKELYLSFHLYMVPGIELGSSGLYTKHFYPLSQLTAI